MLPADIFPLTTLPRYSYVTHTYSSLYNPTYYLLKHFQTGRLEAKDTNTYTTKSFYKYTMVFAAYTIIIQQLGVVS